MRFTSIEAASSRQTTHASSARENATLPHRDSFIPVWVTGQSCTYRLPPVTPGAPILWLLCLCVCVSVLTLGPRRALGRARDTQALTCRQQRFD